MTRGYSMEEGDYSGQLDGHGNAGIVLALQSATDAGTMGVIRQE